MPFSSISTTNPTTLGFGTMNNVRVPTSYWGAVGVPRKTNDTWTNLVVQSGDNPVATFPYIYRAGDNGLNIGYNPTKNDSFLACVQDYTRDYGFYTSETLDKREVIRQDVFGCEYKWYNSSNSNNYLSTCFIKGQSLTTVKYNNLTPVFKCDGAFTKINTAPSLTNGQSFSGSTFRLETNNGKVYKLYAATNVTLLLDTNDWKLTMNATYSNLVKFVYLGLQSETITILNAREAIYDVYGTNSTYVTGGNIDNTTFSGDTANFVINWTKQGTDPILQFAFAHTQDIIQNPNYKNVSLDVVKGIMRGIEGDSWVMIEPLATYDFNYTPFYTPDVQMIKDALASEYQFQPNSDTDTYFGFKELMKLSQLGTIADQLAEGTKREIILDTLVSKINPWLNSTNGNQMKYDIMWGGFTGQEGLADSGASFGSGTYSDHHFHYGYFINACAVLAQLRPSWATPTVKDKVNLWIRDIINPSNSDLYFPQYRCKDWFVGHAWANGTSNQGGSNNQESTSEDINAWYGVYLWGKATGNSQTRDLGRLAMAQSIRAARKYWMMPNFSTIYPTLFKSHKVVGILEGTRSGYNTFFSAAEECIHGIQMLPFSNPTKQYYSNLWDGEEHWNYIRSNILERTYPFTPIGGSIVPGSGYGGTPTNYYGTNLLIQDNCTTTNITGSGTGLKVKVLANPSNGQVVAIEVIGLYANAGSGYAHGDIIKPNTASGNGCTFAINLAVEEGWKGFMYMYRALTNPNDAWTKVQTLTGYDNGNSKTNSLAWVSQFRAGNIPNLATPTISASNITNNGIQLNWDSVGSATAYEVQVALAGDTNFTSPIINNSNVTGLSYTVSGLNSNNNYIYRIRAKDAVPNYSIYSTGNFTTAGTIVITNTLAKIYIYKTT